MGDPTKKKVEAPVSEAEVQAPLTPAQAEQKAQENVQYQNFKQAKKGQPTSVLPFGIRVDATESVERHIKARYKANDFSRVLGDENGLLIVKESFRREHSGWKYAWPAAAALSTGAYIKGDRYKYVPYDAIDHSSGMARVSKSPEGYVMWKSHVLVAVPPAVWGEEYHAPVDDAIGRTAMNRAVVESQLANEFGKHGFKAEYSVDDRKLERISD